MTGRGFEVAMILAAGRGQRMRPLTSVLPKPALPLPDGPVVASALRLATAAGARRIVVNACHLADRLARAVGEVEIDGVEIVLSFEEQLMGTAGGLSLARDRGMLGTEGPVLVINGDCVLSLDLRGFAEHHHANRHLVTLALLPHLDPKKWSRVELDADGLVTGFNPPGRPEALEVPLLYPGVMAVHRDALDSLPHATPGDVPATLWTRVRSQGKLGGLVVAGHWREVGTPEDYLEVMLLRLAGTSVIDPSASASSSARIEDSFIGRNAMVAEGAVVEDSVIAEGAVIGEKATIRRCTLLGEVRAGAGETLVGAVRAAKTAD